MKVKKYRNDVHCGKIFSAFMGVWGNGKCWLTKNCFPIDHKIKALMT